MSKESKTDRQSGILEGWKHDGLGMLEMLVVQNLMMVTLSLIDGTEDYWPNGEPDEKFLRYELTGFDNEHVLYSVWWGDAIQTGDGKLVRKDVQRADFAIARGSARRFDGKPTDIASALQFMMDEGHVIEFTENERTSLNDLARYKLELEHGRG